MDRGYIELLCSVLNDNRRELSTFCRVFKRRSSQIFGIDSSYQNTEKSLYEGISLKADLYFYVYESL